MGWKDWLRRRQTMDPGPQFEADLNLAELRGSRDLRLLEHALGGDDVLAKIAALRALAAMSGPAAADLVSQAGNDAWRAVRIVAAESSAEMTGFGIAIADVGSISPELLAVRRKRTVALPPESLARYIEGLQDPDSAVRLAAAEVLGETGTAAAARPLVTALADSDMSVVSQANESLVALGEAAVPALTEGAESRNQMVRDSARWCLEQIGSGRDA